MEEFLMRSEAPLTPEEWARLEEAATGAARKILVGRRVLPVYGPIGGGLQSLTIDRYRVTPACVLDQGIDVLPEGVECDTIEVSDRRVINVPLIYKDFVLHWRDIATSRQFGFPLDVGPAAAAAAMVALREDEMIFSLLSSLAGTHVDVLDWAEPGNIFGNLVTAMTALVNVGVYGPYAVVVSPAVYAMLHRPMGGGTGMSFGLLEIVQARELASGGVFQSPALAPGQALLIGQGPQNVDLVIGQDLSIAYMGPERMVHAFRAFESVAVRVKRPEAIALIG